MLMGSLPVDRESMGADGEFVDRESMGADGEEFVCGQRINGC